MTPKSKINHHQVIWPVSDVSIDSVGCSSFGPAGGFPETFKVPWCGSGWGMTDNDRNWVLFFLGLFLCFFLFNSGTVFDISIVQHTATRKQCKDYWSKWYDICITFWLFYIDVIVVIYSTMLILVHKELKSQTSLTYPLPWFLWLRRRPLQIIHKTYSGKINNFPRKPTAGTPKSWRDAPFSSTSAGSKAALICTANGLGTETEG